MNNSICLCQDHIKHNELIQLILNENLEKNTIDSVCVSLTTLKLHNKTLCSKLILPKIHKWNVKMENSAAQICRYLLFGSYPIH